MPSAKTEASGLSVALGLSALDIEGFAQSQVETSFEGALAFDKYIQFQLEFSRNRKLFDP